MELTRVDEVLLRSAVALDGEGDITSDGEDHDDTDPDLPTLYVPLIKVTIV
jgi:hypothetical protein